MYVCILYISVDLVQSESGLAYIDISLYLAILQTPVGHYCNTLQSPILQAAIYQYCRVHLALLHYLKGVGQICHSMPQGSTRCHTPANPLAPESL